MGVEKERLSANFLLPNWLHTEHEARFKFAATYLAGKTVVDCACGNGTGSYYFSEQAAKVLAFDISEEALVEARERCRHRKNVVFSIGDATNLPIETNSIDAYVSLETIEHLPDDRPYLQDVVRVLKPGGLFICSSPNRYVTNPGTTVNDKPANEFHVREYTVYEFKALMENYFSRVEVYGQNPNSKLKAAILDKLGFLPFYGAVRIHQLIKLVTHYFRPSTYYGVRPVTTANDFEYVTMVCVK